MISAITRRAPEPLGQHRRQHVGLLGIGQRREYVGAVDVFLYQQLLVGGIAVEHDRVLEDLGDAARALRIALDQFHLIALLERAGEAQADVAAAGDHQPPHRILAAPQLRQHAPQVILGRDEEDLVVLFDDGIADGRHQPVIAIDRGDTGLGIGQVLLQRPQLAAHQQSVATGPHTDQLYAAVGEIDYLQRAGIRQQSRDVLGHELLGADPDVHREPAFGEQLFALRVLGRTDARDLRWRSIERVRDLAGDDIDLVAVGQRHEDVRVGDAGRLEHVGV